MKYKMFIGVIIVFNTKTHLTIEPCLYAAKNAKEAKKKTEKQALKFIEKHHIKCESYHTIVQEQRESEIQQLLTFARTGFLYVKPKRIKMIRDKIEIKLSDEDLFI